MFVSEMILNTYTRNFVMEKIRGKMCFGLFSGDLKKSVLSLNLVSSVELLNIVVLTPARSFGSNFIPNISFPDRFGSFCQSVQADCHT
jgi:hypothetical protein